MNKIYKVIWSEIRGCYVCVSEFVKAHGKSKSSVAKAAGATTLAMALTFSGLCVDSTVWASKKIVQEGGKVVYPKDDAGTYIAIGENAVVLVDTGRLASLLTFNGTNMYYPGSIAVGKNTYSRMGSINIGDLTLNDYTEIGDTTVGQIRQNPNESFLDKGVNHGVASTTLGTNSYVNGSFTTTIGSYNVQTSDYFMRGSSNTLFAAPKNAFATVVGSLNSNESYNSKSIFQPRGVANVINGAANKVTNSNGVIVMGAGNKVQDSLGSINVPVSGNYSSVADLQKAYINGIQKSSGGASLVIGGGNDIYKATYSQFMGVNNKGTNSKYIFADGYNNTISNSEYTAAIGTNNVLDKVKNSQVIGSNRKLSGANNSLVIGVADNETELTVSDATVLGHNANVKVKGGVALGADAVANVGKGVMGWAFHGVTPEDNSIWKATAAAVSVGDSNKKITRQITGVAAGTNDTDAVNVAQLKQASITITAGDGITVVKNGSEYTISANIKGSNTYTDNVTVSKDGSSGSGTGGESGSDNALVIGAETKPTTFAADKGKVYIKPSETLNINGDGNNITTEASDNKINLKLNNDIKVDSISINNGGPVINNQGIDMNNNKITNVANGEISADSKDAVNGSQLHATNQRIDQNAQTIKNLEAGLGSANNRINKVGAGAAALAALHPLDFDPDDKLSFAVGMGNYAGENAAAIGAFYRPTEKVMMSIGGTYGNNENMVNVGLSFALDKPNHVSNSRTAMAKEIVELRGQVAQLTNLVNQLIATNNLKADNASEMLFPDVAENHWAYEYVRGLADSGVLEGYPDGNYKGDRTLTRYEFAASLYKAMQKGAILNERIIKEFEAELGRIRVDRIYGKDDSLNKIERVRVVTAANRDDYGSKIVQ